MDWIVFNRSKTTSDHTEGQIPLIGLSSTYTLELAENLQSSIDKLSKWSNDWLMAFNTDKCSILQLGKNNKKHSYSLNSQTLYVITEQKD